jgi:hypothetical protein
VAVIQPLGCVVASRTCLERPGDSLNGAVEDGSNQALWWRRPRTRNGHLGGGRLVRVLGPMAERRASSALRASKDSTILTLHT